MTTDNSTGGKRYQQRSCTVVRVCRNSMPPAATARTPGRSSDGHHRARSGRPRSRAHHRHVGVLQAGPAHLQVADLLAVLRRTARGRTGGVGRWRARTARRPGSSAPRPRRPPAGRARRREPSAMIRPPARIRIRSASFSASSRSCVVSRIVVSSKSASRCTRSWKSRRACGSKPTVGSSRKSSSGRPTMPIATSSRRRWPPESRLIRCVALLGQPDRLDQLVHADGRRLPGVEYGA